MAVDIAQLLAFAVKNNASDLHLSAGVPPMIRVDGDIKRVNMPPLTHKEVHSMVYDIMNDKQRKVFEEFFETDFSFEIPNLARFRVNAFNQNRGAGAVFRNIPSLIKTLDDLNAPKVFRDLCMLPRGLVLVTGPTGSGKSTTLAGMVDYVNVNRPEHIITIEDPIEFLHQNRKAIVNQREVGLDTRSFPRALRAAMRAAPDVILIGEIRDRETMEAAITLAGTGHLCIASLHANNTAETLDRIINMFPRDQHTQIFLDLSQYLRAIVSQRLVRGRNNKRCAAVEVMLNTPHIQDLIKKGDVIGIKEAMFASNERGIQNYDIALLHLYKEGRIDIEEALNNADSRSNLETRINFG
ncbi:MAG: type IV pilus twitching motility protein PilT [Gammaproteobacteria bacterium]|nr:type IV pilus twitching motility protein PilT [Gammaproteobacteria bacterium]